MKKTKLLFAFLLLAIITTVFAGCGNDSNSGGVGITTTSLSGATVGTAYSQTLAAIGGTTPYTWSISAGALPAGLTLNASTGVISGTPTTAGAVNFTVKVTDSASPAGSATQSVSITVTAPAALAVTTASLAGATVGTAYSQTLAASGGTGAKTWSITVGALPAGLTLTAATGVISGTPTTAGAVNFTVMVTDSASPAGTATKALSIAVTAPAALTITTAALPDGTVGSAYSLTLAATGGSGAYTWAVTAGTLPAGLTLNTSTGVISGTPTGAIAIPSITITVTGAVSGTASKTFSMVVNPAGAALSITTASPLPAATFGTAYSQTLAATGGSGALTWAISAGTLPTGLSLNTSTGVISGTPTAPAVPNAATANFTVGATGAVSGSATKAFALTASLSASASSGKTKYDASCTGCHSLGIYDTSGSPNLGGLGAATLTAALNARFAGGLTHNGQTLTAIQITDMLSFLTLY